MSFRELGHGSFLCGGHHEVAKGGSLLCFDCWWNLRLGDVKCRGVRDLVRVLRRSFGGSFLRFNSEHAGWFSLVSHAELGSG